MLIFETYNDSARLRNKVAELLGKPEIRFESKTEDDGTVVYVVKGNSPRGMEHVAIVRISYFRGCCGQCIITGLQVMPEYRGKGVGTELFKFALAKAVYHGFSAVVATSVDSIFPKMAKAVGMVLNGQYVNNNSGNLVSMWCVYLSDVFDYMPDRYEEAEDDE